MKLDSRILEGKRPLTCIDVEQAREFVGKECIFSDKYENFENLDKYLFVNSDYSAILSIDDTPKCGDYVFRNAKNAAHYGLILPLEWVKEPEKKYRPFSLTEWRHEYAIGDEIVFRTKNSDTVRAFMFCGLFSDHDDDVPGKGVINLGGELFVFQNLFDQFELRKNNEWQPFGVIDEDKEQIK